MDLWSASAVLPLARGGRVIIQCSFLESGYTININPSTRGSSAISCMAHTIAASFDRVVVGPEFVRA